jgi:hypothetical protein
MTVVQSRLPAALTRQAEFFQSLVANNLVAAKVSQEKIAVCKPEGGGIGFHLAKWLADPAAPAPEKDREKQCIKAALHQTGNASRNAPGTEDKGRYDVEVFVDRGAEVTPKGQPKPNHVEPKISVALRSVEGMIYYLGQIARAQTEMSIATPITTAELDGLKQAVMIPLFQVKRDSDVPSVVSVDFEGRTYSIPKLCEGECSATTAHSVQYPQHRSLDVLTLVNQLWGLQKEANNQPPAPAVTVIGQ